MAALGDKRGGSGKDFWLQLKCGSAEDRRAFANIASRLIPVEVKSDLGESLTVVVQTLVAAPNGEPTQKELRRYAPPEAAHPLPPLEPRGPDQEVG